MNKNSWLLGMCHLAFVEIKFGLGLKNGFPKPMNLVEVQPFDV